MGGPPLRWASTSQRAFVALQAIVNDVMRAECTAPEHPRGRRDDTRALRGVLVGVHAPGSPGRGQRRACIYETK